MNHIVLDEEQARILVQTSEPVEVRNRYGTVLGHIQLSEEARIIALIKQRRASPGKKVPAHKVEEMLQMLDQAAQQGATRQELEELSKRLIDEA
jgi:hypothetical protein